MVKDKFYISTAIAYTSAKPHIGNTYEVVLADAIARYKRLQGYDVYFQTGTDEHGEKIELKARENNISPQEYVDNIASCVKDVWDSLNTSYDKFVRTTNSKHKELASKIFDKLYKEDGFIRYTDVLILLNRNPEWIEINSKIKRNE